ncbi:hypothetical protein CR162_05970 [Pseudoroseomonas rhizosphaerae]|uniref:Uncharacterized protein n=1 Tax=Teichococcus rhizosphaerae TaxID=1335062 RepID=A0A2C6Y516_9PROT|nr:hypothetical protein CR162_05970 [Pseudoroseomonas rhizosphaerae]
MQPAARPWRLSPRHALAEGEQQVWIGFGGQADQPWLRLLRPGFRHCFAAIRDRQGWSLVEPLSGRLLVSRAGVAAEFDLPAFYRRAGLSVVGPFRPGPPAGDGWLPNISLYSCVQLCRAVLGAGAPWAFTPHGLYQALVNEKENRKKILDASLPVG